LRNLSKLALALVILTSAYLIVTFFAYQTVMGQRHDEEHLPFWVDYPIYGIIGILLVSFWFALGVKVLGRKTLHALAAAVLLIPILPTSTTSTLAIDVLLVCDEEFNNGHIQPPPDFWYWESKDYAEAAMNYVADYFLEEFDVEIVCHKWVVYLSDASGHEAMLYEAIAETGWFYGKGFDCKPMRLMLVFTQDPNMDWSGWSPYWERALIVKQHAWLRQILMHEIGHQYELYHCGTLECAMNTWSTGSIYSDACGHYQQMMNRREALMTCPDSPDSPPSGGGAPAMI
jgi:hypothetical protein